MGVPGWMTDPEHDGDPVVRKVAPPADSYYGADFSALTPTPEEQASAEEQYVASMSVPLTRSQLLGVVGTIGGASLLLLALALWADALPGGFRLALAVTAVLLPVFAVLARRHPRVLARYQTWMEGPLRRRRGS